MSVGCCEICGEFMLYPESHKCPPVFEIAEVEDPDYWTEIRARDMQQAVEKWAEEDDCVGDYNIINGDEATVLVRKYGEEEISKFIVSGEPVPQYYAQEITDE